MVSHDNTLEMEIYLHIISVANVIIFSGSFWKHFSSVLILPQHIVQLGTWLITGCLMSKHIIYLNGALLPALGCVLTRRECEQDGRFSATDIYRGK